MSLFSLARPLLYRFDPETAHGLSLSALKSFAFLSSDSPISALQTHIAGLTLTSPVGLAAGYDKDAVAAIPLGRLGFGAVEIGTLTPRPQAGNPKPRLFRLVEDEAVINRMGFNNGGVTAALPRIAAARNAGVVVGANIGANKDSMDRIADYVHGIKAVLDHASYLTINISSPNTPGLRALQDENALRELLSAANQARGDSHLPMFLKVAPDLEASDVDAIAKIAVGQVDALIVSNTTISRPALRSVHAGEAGGLSGAPLKALAQQRLVDFRKATGGALPLIGVGGIANAEDAYARIRAGASMVQLYSAMVYHGPGLVAQINRGLAALLARDGLPTIGDAVGLDAG